MVKPVAAMIVLYILDNQAILTDDKLFVGINLSDADTPNEQYG